MLLTNEQLQRWVEDCKDIPNNEPAAMAKELLAARKRIDELERITRQACPCLHATPCDERCTCVNGYSSSGCLRCCSYGSPEQRRAMAIHLVENEKRLQELVYCSERDCRHNSVIASVPCVFCRNKNKELRIEELENKVDQLVLVLCNVRKPDWDIPADDRQKILELIKNWSKR